MTDLQELNEKVGGLAKARNDVQVAKDRIKELQAVPEYIKAIENKKVAETVAGQLDTDIRNMAGQRHDEGLELGHPALNTRHVTEISFDEAQAVKWAIEKEFFGMLKIDTKAFKELAQSLAKAKQPIPNVKIKKKATITIATDLSPYC